MKRTNKLLIGLSLALSIGSLSLLSIGTKHATQAFGYDVATLPKTIDLNDTSANNIRSYYSSLNSLSTSERQGTNLLKNLKTILKNGQKYFSYESGTDVWRMYEITDRDWDKSPTSSTVYGTYNSGSNTITDYEYGSNSSNSKNNPYIHALYINRNVNNQTTAWDDHNQDEWGINREHVWPKAEGFDTSGAGGARGDPMHLMAGNGYSNNIHSNYYYGYVDTSGNYTDCGTKYSNQYGNLRGTSKTLNDGTVFEPQDCDKGDIARAIFYMVARYNYLSGSDSDGIDTNNPNLTLTQNISDWSSSGYTSSTSTQGKLGVLTDLLAWHHADPVDEYEIHRNNLLYTNFTNNRNPFIDFPEWVDFIWGTATYAGSTYESYSSTPTGYAAPSSDTINGYNGGGVTPTVNSVTVSPSALNLDLNGTTTGNLSATVDVTDGGSTSVSWTSSNTNIATVNSVGVVTAVAVGNATITATSNLDNSKYDSCAVTVSDSTPVLSSISVQTAPTKLTYIEGESFDPTGLVITRNYSNANPSTYSYSGHESEFSFSPSLEAELTTGTTSVTISYGGKSVNQSITVNAKKLTSISLDTSNAKTLFSLNETFSYDGLVVTATYDNSTQSVVTPTSVSSVDTSTKGEKTVTVTYTEGGISKTATYAVTVSDTVSATIAYTDTFEPTLPTKADNVNTEPTLHLDSTSGIAFKEVGIYKGSGSKYLMFKNGSGYIYNTISLGTIAKVCVTYNSGAAASAKFGVYFGNSEQSTYVTSGNKTIAGGGNIDTFTNNTAGYGYFQLSSSNGNVQVTQITIEYSAETSVSDVVLSSSSLNLDLYGEASSTLTATVYGVNNPPKTVNWTSNNTSVATVDSEGVVTAVSAGTATITATSTFDSTKSGSCTVTVTDATLSYSMSNGSPYINGLAYKMFFNNTSLSANYYFTGEMSGSSSYYGATSTTIGEGVDVYFEANGDGQNIYFKDSEGDKQYLSVTQNGKYFNFSFSDSVPSTAWHYRVSGNDYACMTYYINSTYYTFGNYSTYESFNTVNLDKYTNNYEVEFVSSGVDDSFAFASIFKNSLTCDASGNNVPSFVGTASWEQFSNVYSKLCDTTKEELRTANADENGTFVERMMKRYEYIVAKYGTDSYSNFINRSITALSVNFNQSNSDESNLLIMLIIIATCSISTLTLLVIKRKRSR